ncbi:hypothetical protein QUA70_02170 [Microcoleus sp. LAD1_D5]|uniref:hypothetical protein n=1 Tax=Microcoleus sp. LAD1_D5 TaxID=2818813 RepID=UPI002FD25373
MVASYYSQSAPSQVRFWLGRAQYYVMLRILTFVRAVAYISSYLFHASLNCCYESIRFPGFTVCININKIRHISEGEIGRGGEGEEMLGAQRSKKYNLKARQLQLTIALEPKKPGFLANLRAVTRYFG